MSDAYVVNFAHAFDQNVLHVFAQAKKTGDGCDETGIVWPLINRQAHGTPTPAGADAPDDTGCWYTACYTYVPDPVAGKLEITWPKLEVVSRQTGSSAWWIVRNANLSATPDVKTNPVLIYQTAKVSFASPVVPTLVVKAQSIPARKTLAETLEIALELFATAGSATGKTRLLRVALNYRYQIGAPSNGGHALWSDLPVVLAASVQLASEPTSATRSDQDITLPELAKRLGADVDTWYGIVHPSTSVAQLVLDVVLYADIDGAQLPIVRAPDQAINVPVGWWPPR